MNETKTQALKTETKTSASSSPTTSTSTSTASVAPPSSASAAEQQAAAWKQLKTNLFSDGTSDLWRSPIECSNDLTCRPNYRLIEYFNPNSSQASQSRKVMNASGHNEFYVMMDALRELIALRASATPDAACQTLIKRVLDFPRFFDRYIGRGLELAAHNAWVEFRDTLNRKNFLGLAFFVRDADGGHRNFFQFLSALCKDAGQKGVDKMCYQFEKFFLESVGRMGEIIGGCDHYFLMLQPHDPQFTQIKQKLSRATYIFTQNEMFYYDGKTVTKIEIFHENLGCIKDELKITDKDEDAGKLKTLNNEQLRSVISISGHTLGSKAPPPVEKFCDKVLDLLIGYASGICRRQGEYPRDDARHIDNLVNIYKSMLESKNLCSFAARFYLHAGDKLKKAIDDFWKYSSVISVQFARHKIACTMATYLKEHNLGKPGSADKIKEGVSNCFKELFAAYKKDDLFEQKNEIISVCTATDKARYDSGEWRYGTSVLSSLLSDMKDDLERLFGKLASTSASATATSSSTTSAVTTSNNPTSNNSSRFNFNPSLYGQSDDEDSDDQGMCSNYSSH